MTYTPLIILPVPLTYFRPMAHEDASILKSVKFYCTAMNFQVFTGDLFLSYVGACSKIIKEKLVPIFGT